MQVGFLDDSSTLYGNPDVTFPIFQQLRTQVLRVDLYWGGAKYAVAKRRPTDAKDPDDPAYDWSLYDRTVNYAAQYGDQAALHDLGDARWANGGKAYRVRAEELQRPAELRVRSGEALQRHVDCRRTGAAAGGQALDGVERAEPAVPALAAVPEGRGAST